MRSSATGGGPQRLVQNAGQAAQHPAGTMTEVFGAQHRARDAAYDFFENPSVSAASIAEAHQRRTAERCVGQPFVFVPVDGSSLQFPDGKEQKGLGFIGSYKAGARGLKVLTAIAVSPDGVPLGVLGQAWWLRKGKVKSPHAQRDVKDKETRYWLQVPQQAQQVLAS